MNVDETNITDVKILTPKLYGDDRGFFVESYALDRYEQLLGIDKYFAQDNISRSSRGVLRGLHFQRDPHAQGKLVSVIAGKVFDVAVDIRVGSETYGKHVTIELSAPYKKPNGEWFWQQFWIPQGFAHGFLTLEDETIFAYKCTHGYVPTSDGGIAWDDAGVAIQWPDVGCKKIISEKDAALTNLKDIEK